MCLIVFAYRHHPDFPLVVAANRDEAYDRPTVSANFWPDTPQLLAGRDRREGGTWLGITRGGRFAAVTNFRDGLAAGPGAARSRGTLTVDFLLGALSPGDYLTQIANRAEEYAGFNVLVGDPTGLFYLSNRDNNGNKPRQLPAGIYGLSNHLLDANWPKIVGGKAALQNALEQPLQHGALHELLHDNTVAADEALPDTRIGIELERVLAPRFIVSERYGTRACTSLSIDSAGEVTFCEQNFGAAGALDEPQYFCFSLSNTW